MNRTIAALARIAVITSGLGAFAAVSLVTMPAAAQWVPPPPEYIATTDPVYYEGHAAYWYGNHWYWRDEHGAWNHYDNEPASLADRRMHGPPDRHDFERGGRHR